MAWSDQLAAAVSARDGAGRGRTPSFGAVSYGCVGHGDPTISPERAARRPRIRRAARVIGRRLASEDQPIARALLAEPTGRPSRRHDRPIHAPLPAVGAREPS